MPTSAPEQPPRFGRIKRSADYARVQGHGRKVRVGELLLVCAPGEGEASRVGFAVSRKVGNAVVRNRVKRWIREVLRRTPPPGRVWDIVLIPSPRIVEGGLAAVERLFQQGLRKLPC